MPTFLTIDEAAKQLRCSAATIRSRIRTGKLPAHRLAGSSRVLIDEAQLLALLMDAREEADTYTPAVHRQVAPITREDA